MLTKRGLLFPFFIGLIGLLLLPVFAPQLRLFTFAPLIIFAIYQKPRIQAVWIAFFCALLFDLFSAKTHFGLVPATYCLSTFLIYPQKQHFFADSLSTLPLMTFFFSALSTLLFAICLILFRSSGPTLTPSWFFSDVFIYPMIDALFAFVIFSLPGLFIGKRPKKGKDYFSES